MSNVILINPGAFGPANPVDHEHDWVEAEGSGGVLVCWCEATAEPAPPTPKEPLLNQHVRDILNREREQHVANVAKEERAIAELRIRLEGHEKAVVIQQARIADIDKILDLEAAGPVLEPVAS